MRVLVTGGAGYIGSMLVRALLREKYRVTVVDNFMYRQMPFNDLLLDRNLNVIRGDCRDPRVMEPALADADSILPLAAIVGAPACDRDTVAARSTNYAAINWLAARASRQQRIILPTTNSGYGVGEPGKECTEETPLNPISLYGRSKRDAESELLGKANAITLRLATVFGMSPRMRLDLLVNDFVHRAVTDRSVVLFEGHFKRNYIHVTDVVRAFLFCLTHFDRMRFEAYNVGLSDANLSKIELCERIKAKVPGFTYLEAPIGEDPDKRDYVVSNAKIEAAGWNPLTSLDEGIGELVRGYRMLRTDVHGNA